MLHLWCFEAGGLYTNSIFGDGLQKSPMPQMDVWSRIRQSVDPQAERDAQQMSLSHYGLPTGQKKRAEHRIDPAQSYNHSRRSPALPYPAREQGKLYHEHREINSKSRRKANLHLCLLTNTYHGCLANRGRISHSDTHCLLHSAPPSK